MSDARAFPAPPRQVLGIDLVAFEFRDQHPALAMAQVAVHFEQWDADFLHSMATAFDLEAQEWSVLVIVDAKCDPDYEFAVGAA